MLYTTLLLSGFILAVDHPPEDDKFKSENQASGIRPPAADFLLTQAGRKKAGEKVAIPASDIKAIEAKKDEDVVVKGVVHEVFIPRSGSIAILNFGKDNKKCFKAVVFKSDFEKWDGGAEGIKKKYQGKTVTVEGKVSLYQGLPQIAVKTPSQFKVQ
jgi:DNA/RNA endonuclease YhcR with UshA esterase domain